MDNIVLKVQELHKKYASGAGIKNVSFNIEKGTIVGVIGLNGAGKSTLFSCITNPLKRDGGNVIFQGKELEYKDCNSFHDIGVIDCEQGYPEDFNAKNISKIMKYTYSNWNERVFKKILEDFGIDIKKKIGNYSTGMKSKLSIALALSHNAKLLILDEPTNGLDLQARSFVRKYLYDFVQDEEKAILLSSHIISDVEKIADKIILLYQGSIILECSKDDLLYKYATYRISNQRFSEIDKGCMVRYKPSEIFTTVLVENKDKFQAIYGLEPELASVENIVELFLEGEMPEC